MGVSKDHYYRLASNLSKERIQAATSLIKELAEENSETEYKYALQRLMSGLASGHDSARIGFSMCLTELLSLLSGSEALKYTAKTFLSDLNTHLDKTVKAKHKGKNLRAYLFAKIFGIQSLIGSSLLDDPPHSLIIEIIDELFSIALTKSWIREISVVTIIKLINKLHLAADREVIPYVLTKLAENSLLLSMDGLLVYLTIPVAERKNLSDLASIQRSQHWKNDDPLTKGNLAVLKDAFLDRIVHNDNGDDEDNNESETNEKDKKKKKKTKAKNDQQQPQIQKGSWNPQLHYVWVPLLSELMENERETSQEPPQKKKKSSKGTKNDKKTSNKLSLATFWPTFDATFFSANASPERKHTGLQILDLSFKLPSFIPEFFSVLFDQNITRCLINHTSKKDRVLHSLSVNVLENATKTSKTLRHENARLCMVRSLERQCVLFDRVSKSKIIRDILSNIFDDESDPNNLETEVTFWVEIIDWIINKSYNELSSKTNNKDDTHSLEEDVHTFIFDSLLNVVRGNKRLIKAVIEKSNDKVLTLQVISQCKEILEYFAKVIYVKAQIPYSGSTLKLAKDRLSSVLSDLMECSKNQVDWSGFLVEFLHKYDQSNELITTIDNLDKIEEVNDADQDSDVDVDADMGYDSQLDIKQVKEKSFKAWNELVKSVKSTGLNISKSRISKCLIMLLSTALLELYGGDSESVSILNDLDNVYEDFKQGNESSNILDTLIDLMLSYTTQKSKLKKRIGNNIWESVFLDIKQEQLDRLFDVLMTRENKAGMEQLFNQAIDEYDDEDKDEDEDEDEGEANEENENSENKLKEGTESESESEEPDEESEDNVDRNEKIEEVEKSATTALAKALKIEEAGLGHRKNNHDISANREADEKEEQEQEQENDDDKEDDDDDDDDDDNAYESDESMSDEQMLAIDSQLSAIFQQRKSSLDELRSSSKNGNERKLEAKNARELMALCKLRVLDLLDSYVSNPETQIQIECASIAIILLDLMELTIDINVGEKAHKLIKKTCKHTFQIPEDKLGDIFDLLDQVLSRASKGKFAALGQACSQVAIYLVRSIVAVNPEKYEEFISRATEIYLKHLIKWAVTPRDKANASLFTDFVNWLNTKRTPRS